MLSNINKLFKIQLKYVVNQKTKNIVFANEYTKNIFVSFKDEIMRLFTPPAILIRENGEILYIHGRTGKYLEPAAGQVSINNIFDMAREGLRLKLNTLVRNAVKNGKEINGSYRPGSRDRCCFEKE